jgi:supervillin
MLVLIWNIQTLTICHFFVGRRYVQVRVVEPSEASLCSDDCYVLITSTQLWIWIGKNSNIIEKARVQDLAGRVLKCHEFGCNAKLIQKIEEKVNYQNGKRQAMLTLLPSDSLFKAGKESKNRLPDEEYEKLCLNEIKVYDVRESELVLNKDLSGKQLSYGKLSSDKVNVYDFGSEVYVWCGKNTTSAKRLRAIQLAQTLCAPEKSFPNWGLLCPVTEGHAPLLFREKFPDWPEPGRIIKAKGHISSGELTERSPPPELFPVPPETFGPTQHRNTDICVLERVNIGRGQGHGDYNVETADLTVWLIRENTYTELPQQQHGEFCSQEAYVVRWGYRLINSSNGIRGSGLYRCCYFFWQGEHCSVTEKTASALLTVELDQEQGPQIRVIQHKEPPVFLQLFNNGGMVVYHERSLFERTAAGSNHVAMFTVRSCVENELYILQLPDVNSAWLQSVSSFIIVSYEAKCLFVWHGSESADSICVAAMKCATSLSQRLVYDLMKRSGLILQSWSICVSDCPQGVSVSLVLSQLKREMKNKHFGMFCWINIQRIHQWQGF